ncbi:MULTISPECIES: hypothetical protein [unclassified Microbacterium]|uniref:hypothetical protein n=1 Tax=unclassified Microbacterium TaxID=2609290 RepID=UPI0024687623|nr:MULTISPECIES: hypothetical protein [unclassified Microbacterium]MDH5134056.1 hypothetical protein [Microbacterium sp. RD10]MDH5136840.1 hypothetical protein [Microbacterium sp. RD11]MDH5146379.1 hypothetical protein [Microbacterium sp. RD12]MDH5156577.1 hypothetical protein [Microbacterium sp. RD06]MDH5168158.1 hypothetical protein [Microbacterium sp. RD02]
MRTLTWTAITLTAIILAYILRRPALNWAFNNKTDQPETPDGWTPKMRTYKHGVLVGNMNAIDEQLELGLPGGPLSNPGAFVGGAR